METPDSTLCLQLVSAPGLALLSEGHSSHQKCVLTTAGTVLCWGYCRSGRCGFDVSYVGDAPGEMDALVPVDFGSDVKVASIHTLNTGMCVLTTEGRVKCIGWNAYGALGYGDTVERGGTPETSGDNLPFVDLGTGRTAKQLSAGYGHICAVLDNDQIKCWGYNGENNNWDGFTFGQLGTGDLLNRGDDPDEMGDNLPYVPLGEGRSAKAVSAGGYHTCALRDDDRVLCWGLNERNQLMQGSERVDFGGAVPTNPIAGLSGVKQLAAGGYGTCVLLTSGAVKCWGWGPIAGQGDIHYTSAIGNVTFATGVKVLELAPGLNHYCARVVYLSNVHTPSIVCWGDNDYGQLGMGDTALRRHTIHNIPLVDVGVGNKVVCVSLGIYTTTVIIETAPGVRRIKSFGRNDYGQLGIGDSARRGDGPNEMGDALPFAAVPMPVRFRRGVVLAAGSTEAVEVGLEGAVHRVTGEAVVSVRCGVVAPAGGLVESDRDWIQLELIPSYAAPFYGSAFSWSHPGISLTGLKVLSSINVPGGISALSLQSLVVLELRGSSGLPFVDMSSFTCVSSFDKLHAVHGAPVEPSSVPVHLSFSPDFVAFQDVEVIVRCGPAMISRELLASVASFPVRVTRSVFVAVAGTSAIRGSSGASIPEGEHLWVGSESAVAMVQGATSTTAVALQALIKVYPMPLTGQIVVACVSSDPSKLLDPGDVVLPKASTEPVPVTLVTGGDGLEAPLAVTITCSPIADGVEIYATDTAVFTVVVLPYASAPVNPVAGWGAIRASDGRALPHLVTLSQDDPALTPVLINGGTSEPGRLVQLATVAPQSVTLAVVCHVDIESVGVLPEVFIPVASTLPVDLHTPAPTENLSAGPMNVRATCYVRQEGGYALEGALHFDLQVIDRPLTVLASTQLQALEIGRFLPSGTELGLPDGVSVAVLSGATPRLDVRLALAPSVDVTISCVWKGFGTVVGGPGRSGMCGIADTGDVYCFGDNSTGALGYGDLSNRGEEAETRGENIPPVPFLTGSVSSVGTGAHTCVVADGSVYCFGSNDAGELGLGHQISTTGVTEAVNLSIRVVSVHVGSREGYGDEEGIGAHTCVIGTAGELMCFGSNVYGQLGLGDANMRGIAPSQLGAALPAVRLGPGLTAVKAALGGGHTCALLEGGGIKCWGYGTWGALGSGSTEHIGRTTTVPEGPIYGLPFVGLGEQAVDIVAGERFSCALLLSGGLKCWGFGVWAAEQPTVTSPTLVSLAAARVAAGREHLCAMDPGDAIRCVGANEAGQLGAESSLAAIGIADGADLESMPVVDIGTDVPPMSMGACKDGTCVLAVDGTMRCWGAGLSLLHGDGTPRGSGVGDMGSNLPVSELPMSTHVLANPAPAAISAGTSTAPLTFPTPSPATAIARTVTLRCATDSPFYDAAFRVGVFPDNIATCDGPTVAQPGASIAVPEQIPLPARISMGLRVPAAEDVTLDCVSSDPSILPSPGAVTIPRSSSFTDCVATAGRVNVPLPASADIDGEVTVLVTCAPTTDAERHGFATFSVSLGHMECGTGQRDVAGVCVDIDECLEDPGVCGPGGQCINTAGGHECTCSEGFSLQDGICRDIDECVDPSVCGDQGLTCTNTPGSYSCDCSPGYEFDGVSCVDIQECDIVGICGPPGAGQCTNTPGGYSCSCSAGYRLGDSGSCEDIVECVETPSICSYHGSCYNTMGSYRCDCSSGFEFDGVTCVDVPECTRNPDICGLHGVCFELVGSYSCGCTDGHVRIGSECVLSSSCLANPGICGTGICRDVSFGYMCDCGPGKFFDGQTCSIVTSCAQRPDVCGTDANCEDDPTSNSYSCTCPTGYIYTNGTCTDIDECSNLATACGANATCYNTMGSYMCMCDSGFQGNGLECVDIDECTEYPDICGAGICFNFVGAYGCTCGSGMRFDGSTCVVDGSVPSQASFLGFIDPSTGASITEARPLVVTLTSAAMSAYAELKLHLSQRATFSVPPTSTMRCVSSNAALVPPIWLPVAEIAPGGISQTLFLPVLPPDSNAFASLVTLSCRLAGHVVDDLHILVEPPQSVVAWALVGKDGAAVWPMAAITMREGLSTVVQGPVHLMNAGVSTVPAGTVIACAAADLSLLPAFTHVLEVDVPPGGTAELSLPVAERDGRGGDRDTTLTCTTPGAVPARAMLWVSNTDSGGFLTRRLTQHVAAGSPLVLEEGRGPDEPGIGNGAVFFRNHSGASLPSGARVMCTSDRPDVVPSFTHAIVSQPLLDGLWEEIPLPGLPPLDGLTAQTEAALTCIVEGWPASQAISLPVVVANADHFVFRHLGDEMGPLALRLSSDESIELELFAPEPPEIASTVGCGSQPSTALSIEVETTIFDVAAPAQSLLLRVSRLTSEAAVITCTGSSGSFTGYEARLTVGSSSGEAFFTQGTDFPAAAGAFREDGLPVALFAETPLTALTVSDPDDVDFALRVSVAEGSGRLSCTAPLVQDLCASGSPLSCSATCAPDADLRAVTLVISFASPPAAPESLIPAFQLVRYSNDSHTPPLSDVISVTAFEGDSPYPGGFIFAPVAMPIEEVDDVAVICDGSEGLLACPTALTDLGFAGVFAEAPGAAVPVTLDGIIPLSAIDLDDDSVEIIASGATLGSVSCQVISDVPTGVALECVAGDEPGDVAVRISKTSGSLTEAFSLVPALACLSFSLDPSMDLADGDVTETISLAFRTPSTSSLHALAPCSPPSLSAKVLVKAFNDPVELKVTDAAGNESIVLPSATSSEAPFSLGRLATHTEYLGAVILYDATVAAAVALSDRDHAAFSMRVTCSDPTCSVVCRPSDDAWQMPVEIWRCTEANAEGTTVVLQLAWEEAPDSVDIGSALRAVMYDHSVAPSVTADTLAIAVSEIDTGFGSTTTYLSASIALERYNFPPVVTVQVVTPEPGDSIVEDIAGVVELHVTATDGDMTQSVNGYSVTVR